MIHMLLFIIFSFVVISHSFTFFGSRSFGIPYLNKLSLRPLASTSDPTNDTSLNGNNSEKDDEDILKALLDSNHLDMALIEESVLDQSVAKAVKKMTDTKPSEIEKTTAEKFQAMFEVSSIISCDDVVCIFGD